MPGSSRTERIFARLSAGTVYIAGRPWTFSVCLLVVVAWVASGPLFRFSDTWQLIMNTTSSIVTLLMVFVLQNAQNRDSAALQIKLDELIRATRARNEVIGAEHLSDSELENIRDEMGADAAEGRR